MRPSSSTQPVSEEDKIAAVCGYAARHGCHIDRERLAFSPGLAPLYRDACALSTQAFACLAVQHDLLITLADVNLLDRSWQKAGIIVPRERILCLGTSEVRRLKALVMSQAEADLLRFQDAGDKLVARGYPHLA